MVAKCLNYCFISFNSLLHSQTLRCMFMEHLGCPDISPWFF